MLEAAEEFERLVMAVHRRNGGSLTSLNFGWRLLEPVLGIDSLDLAEIIVEIERRFGVSPFDAPAPPRTWQDIVNTVEQRTTDIADNADKNSLNS
jgi:acyl carrier protein